MAGIGGIYPVERGISTLSDFDVTRCGQFDEIDAVMGGFLSRPEGRLPLSVFVVFDRKREGADAWDFDFLVISRFEDVDVAVESISGTAMAIAIGEAPTESPRRILPSDGGANDKVNSCFDLSWREHAPAGDAFGMVVERV